jgi:hypothetical protein
MYLSLRTKATIEEGIQWREKLDDGREAVCYCPGDGTRYVIIVSPMGGYSDGTLESMGLSTQWENIVITFANDPGHVRSFITHRGAFVDHDSVRSKLDVTFASSITLAEFIGWLIDGDAWSCDRARKHYSDDDQPHT